MLLCAACGGGTICPMLATRSYTATLSTATHGCVAPVQSIDVNVSGDAAHLVATESGTAHALTVDESAQSCPSIAHWGDGSAAMPFHQYEITSAVGDAKLFVIEIGVCQVLYLLH